MRALLWTLFSRSAWAQPATIVAGTISKVVDVASVLSVGFGSDSLCDGDHNIWGRWCGLCSICRRAPSQPLLFWARDVRVQLWPLFSRSAWAKKATVLADTIGVGVFLASFLFDVVRSSNHCGGGNEK